VNVWLVAALAIYFVGLLALSIHSSRRVTSEEEYVVAGRRLPLSLAWGTLLATWFGAATMLGAAEAAREQGLLGTILDPFASGASLIVAGIFFARPLWQMKLLTLGDFYGRKFGSRTEIVASIVLVPSYFGWIAAQFIALGEIFRMTTAGRLPSAGGRAAAAAVVLAFTLMGGMWSVTLTDSLQLVLVLLGLLVLAAEVLGELGAGSLAAGLTRLASETPPEMLTLLPPLGWASMMAWSGTWASGLLGNIPGQDLTQRIFASKDSRTASRACILAGAVYLAFGLIPVGMGLASRILLPQADGRSILSLLAGLMLGPLLQAVFVTTLVSIIVSTATSALLSPATVLAHNLLARIPWAVATCHGNRLLMERISVVIVCLGGLAMAFSNQGLLELLESALSMTLVGLFVPLVCGIYGRPRGEWPAILAIVCGVGVWLVRELLEGVVLIMPATADGAADGYARWVRGWSAASLSPLPAVLLSSFAVLPSVISGLLASLAGYFVGQAVADRNRDQRQERRKA
jgi:Na+/proline symporter